MFSSIIRLGAAISVTAILSSCGGSSGQAETQNSTPEGLFSGVTNITYTSTNGTALTASQQPSSQNMLEFVVYNGASYSFFYQPNSTTALAGAAEGTLTYSGGSADSSALVQVSLPTSASGSCSSGSLTNTSETNPINVTNPNFVGAYNTGQNFAGTFTYPVVTNNAFAVASFNLNYNSGYQGVQSLATLAGTYTGTVGSSQCSESATFTFGPATVAANTGNEFGIGTITGTGASGCAYSGSVSPLVTGNGYTTTITSGGAPCVLANQQFTGLVYLNTANNQLVSFAPNTGRTDGLIFYGTKQ